MGITVEKKKLRDGRTALYLNYCFGHKRWRESLHLTLDMPADTATRRLNREKLTLAMHIRSMRELEFAARRHGLCPPQQAAEADCFELCRGYAAEYRRRDVKMVYAMCAHLHRFAGKPPLPLWQVDRAFCQRFYDYLREHLSGHTPTGYFHKFRQCLDHAVELRLLAENPAAGIRTVRHTEFTKSVLNGEEMNRLAATACRHPEVKRAFLFACHTGLRWCDVAALRAETVDLTGRMLHLVQQKVAGRSARAVLHLALNATAVRLLLAAPCAPDGHVFALPSYSYAGRVLKRWVRDAGIGKHITFHCARHSFITNLLIGGANIKTAAELAGHSTIRHTEKYIHIVDELKRKAVDSLPPLRFDS